jgi:hypothetical protein
LQLTRQDLCLCVVCYDDAAHFHITDTLLQSHNLRREPCILLLPLHRRVGLPLCRRSLIVLRNSIPTIMPVRASRTTTTRRRCLAGANALQCRLYLRHCLRFHAWTRLVSTDLLRLQIQCRLGPIRVLHVHLEAHACSPAHGEDGTNREQHGHHLLEPSCGFAAGVSLALVAV